MKEQETVSIVLAFCYSIIYVYVCIGINEINEL